MTKGQKQGLVHWKKFGCSLYDHTLLFLCPHNFMSIHKASMAAKKWGKLPCSQGHFPIRECWWKCWLGILAAGKIIATLIQNVPPFSTYAVQICVCIHIYIHTCMWVVEQSPLGSPPYPSQQLYLKTQCCFHVWGRLTSKTYHSWLGTVETRKWLRVEAYQSKGDDPAS